MSVILLALAIFSLFLLFGEDEPPLLDDEWARAQWLRRNGNAP